MIRVRMGLDGLGVTQGLLNSVAREALLAIALHRRHGPALRAGGRLWLPGLSTWEPGPLGEKHSLKIYPG